MSQLLFVLALLTQSPDPDSVEQPQIEAVAYAADSVVLQVGSRDILLVGSSRIDYRDMFLEADTVRYTESSGSLVASGLPELFDRGESIRGSRMYYSLRTRRGRIDSAGSQYEFGYYEGSSITQVGRREYNIVDARFTTCDRDSLDYYFFSPQMKVFQDEKAIARPVYLYVDDTPVFYFPYWVFPIRSGRQSGFTIPKFGQTSRDGRYLRGLGYYFAFSDYIDLLLQGDIMERTRFALSAEERHSLRYIHQGSLKVEWRREFESHLDRWRLFGQHIHDFPDGTAVRIRGEFLSDRNYLEETQQTPEDRMEREIRSWVSVNRSLGRMSLQLVLDRTQYLNTDPDSIPDERELDQELPDFRLSIPASPLFAPPSDPARRRPWHSVYWSMSSHYVAIDSRREETRFAHSGLRTTADLSSSMRLGGILSLTPRINGVATVYDRDRAGDSYPWWLAGSAGLTASTDIYGVFPSSLFGFSAFRHTLTPSATLSWAPGTYLASGDDGMLEPAQADSASGRFFSFSDLAPPSSARRLTLSLFQSLEARRIEGDIIDKVQLASLDLSTTADLEKGDSIFTPLTASLALTPVQQFSAVTDASWDFYSSELKEVDFTTTIRLDGTDHTLLPDSIPQSSGMPWRLSLSHYYRLGLGEQQDLSKMRASAALGLTPDWSLEYSAYYDLLEGSFINQSYTLTRDLHCWEAVFVRQISDADSGFYFRINIKDLPDIKIEQHVSNF